MEKIGLFGGTFDPVHAGHVQVACAAVEEMELDRVLMIPAVVPPHKEHHRIAPLEHRAEMIRLELADHDKIELSLVEADLPTPSYTIDTVKLFQEQYPPTTRFYFIIGADAFIDILSWKAYRELLDRVTLLVADRQGFDEELFRELQDKLHYSADGNRWRHCGGFNDIVFLNSSIKDVSSSFIRERLARREGRVDGISAAVQEYIEFNMLYCY